MCTDSGSADVAFAAPRLAEGAAVDPIELAEVDELSVTVLTDNSYDALMADHHFGARTRLGDAAPIPARLYTGKSTYAGLIAEHGFAAVIRTRRGDRTHTLLFDTGISPTGMVTNGRRIGVDPTEFEGVVLSHGHSDHTGGLGGLADWRGPAGMPLLLHPAAWTRRRINPPTGATVELAALSPNALRAEGFEVIERRHPSVLLDDSVLITGEVDRTTEFERGMPNHEAFVDGDWRADPWITDDQALVVRVRDRGLVVITGCGHAGAVNIVRHAMRLTGTEHLHALLGGLHLTGQGFERIIEPTVAALAELSPEAIVPAHCTGWRAQHRLAAALPDAFVPGSVGTTYTFAA